VVHVSNRTITSPIALSHQTLASGCVDASPEGTCGNSALRRRANPVTDWPLTAALAAIGGKWKLIIIYWLAEESMHFAGLRRKLPEISQKVLTQQLRELRADAIVDRRPAHRVPEPVVYSLTPYGRSLLPLVESVRLWGRSHLERYG
jgi:DNA-binding HxlR family transcriptional regulator